MAAFIIKGATMYILVENNKGELTAHKFVELSPAQRAMWECYNEQSIFPLQEFHMFDAAKSDGKNVLYSWRIFNDADI